MCIRDSSRSIVGYLGPNGAGKTTTINVLTTAMVPTRGDAWVCGYNVRTQKAEIRKHIAVATQDLYLDPFITIYDNMSNHEKPSQGFSDCSSLNAKNYSNDNGSSWKENITSSR